MYGFKPWEVKNMLIDTDGGSDDVVAIAMALLDDDYNVDNITCVAGNVNLQTCYNNVCTLLDEMKIKHTNRAAFESDEVGVIPGSYKPLVKDLITADETHGKDGLSGKSIEHETVSSNIEETIRVICDASCHGDRIVCLGPLTNIAIACKWREEAMKRADLWIMGSAGLGEGNVTPYSEYNIFVDPEAAKIVFDTCENIHVIGWDACMKYKYMMFDESDITSFRRSELGTWLVDCNQTLIDLNKERFHTDREYIDFADPVAMGCALQHIANFEKYPVNVDVQNASVVFDVYDLFNYKRFAKVCRGINSDMFKELIHDHIPYFPEVS